MDDSKSGAIDSGSEGQDARGVGPEAHNSRPLAHHVENIERRPDEVAARVHLHVPCDARELKLEDVAHELPAVAEHLEVGELVGAAGVEGIHHGVDERGGAALVQEILDGVRDHPHRVVRVQRIDVVHLRGAKGGVIGVILRPPLRVSVQARGYGDVAARAHHVLERVLEVEVGLQVVHDTGQGFGYHPHVPSGHHLQPLRHDEELAPDVRLHVHHEHARLHLRQLRQNSPDSVARDRRVQVRFEHDVRPHRLEGIPQRVDAVVAEVVVRVQRRHFPPPVVLDHRCTRAIANRPFTPPSTHAMRQSYRIHTLIARNPKGDNMEGNLPAMAAICTVSLCVRRTK